MLTQLILALCLVLDEICKFSATFTDYAYLLTEISVISFSMYMRKKKKRQNACCQLTSVFLRVNTRDRQSCLIIYGCAIDFILFLIEFVKALIVPPSTNCVQNSSSGASSVCVRFSCAPLRTVT